MSITEKKETLADNLGYFMGNEIPVAIVGDSALILHPWSKDTTGDLFLEISKRCHGHHKHARVKLTALGGKGALEIAEQLYKDHDEGYETCVVLWNLNEVFGRRKGLKYWMSLKDEIDVLKQAMSRFHY
eukprot:9361609-Karenia_brevis.AAC.1